MQFLVTGGRQKRGAHFKPEWQQHDRCLAFFVNFELGKVETALEYVSPPEARPANEPAIQFKAASIYGDEVFLCTTTEILVHRLPGMESTGYISLPRFNDVHHVLAVDRETLLVANTGLDMMVEMQRDGKVLREWSTLDEDPWARFDRAIDYRLVETTKPHASHPNFGFVFAGEYWATRFEQRDAICLTSRCPAIPIGVQRPHDGVVLGDEVWFTTVDGQIVASSPGRDAPRAVYDLNSFAGTSPDRALGWCRGLYLVDDRHVLVGFSRLRPSVFRSNLRWVKHRFGARDTSGDMATRISLYDLAERRLVREVQLEEVGLSTVFSILPVGEGGLP